VKLRRVVVDCDEGRRLTLYEEGGMGAQHFFAGGVDWVIADPLDASEGDIENVLRRVAQLAEGKADEIADALGTAQ
jgi:hypothetical protein